MRAGPPTVLAAVLVSLLAILSVRDGVRANGLVQREIRGRLASVDTGAGRLVVLREYRGHTTRVTLRADRGASVCSCRKESAGLDRVKRGMVVSVFYEAAGSEGVANLIAIERAR